MKRFVVSVAAVAATLSIVACGAKREVDPSGVVQSGVVEERVVEAVATVTKVDPKTRTVTLRAADGHAVPIHAGPEVKNFDQIDVGDEVEVAYYESVAFDVLVPGKATPGVSVAGGTETAEPGQKPAALGARIVTVTSTIEAIEKNPPSVTLRLEDGSLQKIKVRNPAHLENVEVGDLVEIHYTQAVAVTVEETAK